MTHKPHDHDAPQLRTLLLTDLCDSTALVERLGDIATAAFYRDHDRLVLELQQRWRGRLIDRSDGLLLLFERPLDGLGFALDYRRGLEGLGQAHDVGRLLARAGLHVGEVLIWRNSDEAVASGAKPVEVEGLAKPYAARLMQLARPGQILLSAVAQPLVRRAAGELGERGQSLRWRSHGQWRFKGMPEVQEIHEVGEAGLAPLQMPRGNAKSRRDQPLWRRPLALVAEVALLAGVAVGAWYMTRPQPAIAFAERDWVVVGDLRNLTGQTVLDESLEQAFRISLEQSRHVNVLSDVKVGQTLALMRHDPGPAALDRATAAQVALRDGARAVLLPTVLELDNRLQFSVEVVDPHTLATVFTGKASGKGLDSVLASIDQVTADLRGGLGEAMASIKGNSVPLPQATTANLDALRAYALAAAAVAQGRFEEAHGQYTNAIRLDREFSRAHLGLAAIAMAQGHADQARRHVLDAGKARDTLAARDRLMLAAWEMETSASGGQLAEWSNLARLYPDDFGAQSNTSWYLMEENRFEEALPHALAASIPQAPWRNYSLAHVARIHVAKGEAAAAMKVLDDADQPGRPASVGARAEALLLLGRGEEAAQLLRAVTPDDPSSWLQAQQGLASLALAAGDRARAIEIANRAQERAAKLPAPYPLRFALVRAVVHSAAGQPLAASELASLERQLRAELADPELPARHEGMFRYAVLAYLAQRDGHGGLAATAIHWLQPQLATLSSRKVERMIDLVRAHQLGLEGRADEGVELLHKQLDGSEFLQARVVLGQLERERGNTAAVEAQAAWLRERRGLALAEVVSAQLLQPLNMADVRAAGPSPEVAISQR